jgi:hypothetical protein
VFCVSLGAQSNLSASTPSAPPVTTPSSLNAASYVYATIGAVSTHNRFAIVSSTDPDDDDGCLFDRSKQHIESSTAQSSPASPTSPLSPIANNNNNAIGVGGAQNVSELFCRLFSRSTENAMRSSFA